MSHNYPINVEKYAGTLEELAKDICAMQYDRVAATFGHLGDELSRQAYADREKGRSQLAHKLQSAADRMYLARDRMISAWKISQKHMQENKEK